MRPAGTDIRSACRVDSSRATHNARHGPRMCVHVAMALILTVVDVFAQERAVAGGDSGVFTQERAVAGGDSGVFAQERALTGGDAGAVALQRFEYRQIVMAIEARIVLHAADEETARAAAAAAFARLDGIDATCSDYRVDSELMRLCAGAGGPAAPVSADLFAVLARAQQVSAASGGAFDVTCGNIVALWREARATGVLPSAGALATAVQLSGFAALDVNADTRSVAFAAPGMRLDLGGIAKGYACEQAVRTLAEHGVTSALVELGGDIALGDPPPGESGWSVDAGCGEGGVGPTHLSVARCSVATSGDTSQSVEIDGVRYSHIVDPRSGRPLSTAGSGATALCCTVIAPEGATADALASACRVLGPRAGRVLVAAFPGARLICEDGSRPIFDGRTLSGWTTRGGRYDGDAVWSVEDGCLVGRTGEHDAGGLIYTDMPHTSFELSLDCMLDRPFDSGIFVRMTPDAKGAQVTLDDRPDGEIAGLYSDGWLQHAGPAAAAAWRENQWNSVVVRCTGFDMRVQAWINGALVLDASVPQQFGRDGRAAFAPRGLIGLQVHGGGGELPDARARFRDIRLRDLPVLDDGEALATAKGWEELIAGRGESGESEVAGGVDVDPAAGASARLAQSAAALAAWEAVDGEGLPRAPDDYRVVDGVLRIPSSEPGGYLRTKANFRDFALRMEFRQARMSNSGVFLRGRRETLGPGDVMGPGSNPAYSGCEVQLLDDFDWEAVTASTLKDWQFTGSLYGAVAPGVKALHPIGEWNTLEILYRDSRLAVALNGLTLYDVDTSTLNVEPPFSLRAPGGFLGLQRYAAPDVPGDTALWVRGMRVRRL